QRAQQRAFAITRGNHHAEHESMSLKRAPNTTPYVSPGRARGKGSRWGSTIQQNRAGRRLACTIASLSCTLAPLRADHWRLCSCFVRPLALGLSHGSLVRSRQTPAGAHALLARPPSAGGRVCAPSAVSAA